MGTRFYPCGGTLSLVFTLRVERDTFILLAVELQSREVQSAPGDRGVVQRPSLFRRCTLVKTRHINNIKMIARRFLNVNPTCKRKLNGFPLPRITRCRRLHLTIMPTVNWRVYIIKMRRLSFSHASSQRFLTRNRRHFMGTTSKVQNIRLNDNISNLMIINGTSPQHANNGPNILTHIPLRQNTTIITTTLNSGIRHLNLNLTLLTRGLVMIRTFRVAMLIGKYRIQIHRTRFFTLVGMKNTTRGVSHHHRRLNTFLPMNHITTGTTSHAKLIIITPRRHVPTTINLRPLLPNLRRFLRNRMVELPRFPLLPILMISLRIIRVRTRHRLIITLDNMTSTIFRHNKKRLPRHSRTISTTHNSRLLRMLISITTVNMRTTTITLGVILVSLQLKGSISSIRARPLSTLHLPRSRSINRFLPRNKILPIRINLRRVMRIRVPLTRP